jgi:hypothetical protein
MTIAWYNWSLVTHPKGQFGIYKYDIDVIAGPLLVNCYFPNSCWSQVELHTPDLWLTAYPHMHLIRENTKRFPICVRLGYVEYVPISPPQHTLMG